MSTPSLSAQQVAIRDHLIEALNIDLVGPMKVDEVLPNPPSRWYLTGFLVPSGASEEQRVDALADEGMEAEMKEAAEESSDDVKPVRSFLPSSIGLSFQVPNGVSTLEVVARWGDYEELPEDETRVLFQAEKARRRRVRSTVDRGGDDDDGDDKDLRFRYWRRLRSFERIVPIDLDADEGHALVPGGSGVYLQWLVRPTPDHSARAISLFMVNGRDPVEGSAADERSLFQTALEVRCGRGFVPRRRTVTTEHPDDLRNDLQFRDHCEWAVGHGVAIEAEANDTHCPIVRTTWLPTARVYRMAASDVEGVELRMERLAALDDVSTLRGQMTPLFRDYQAWIDRQRGGLGALSATRQTTAQRLLDEAELALARMNEGLDTLASDPEAFLAFKLANTAMAAAARKQREGQVPSWRLFQLAFVLVNLAGATDPTHADRDRVELLFFPTGGGKTEAYLGVAAYMLVLRRLRYRETEHGGAGVAVLLRYTLRLLTLDQLRRAAQLICALELERREQPDLLGGVRFSIGLWVGRSASANRMEDVKKPVKQLKEHGRVFGGPPPVPLASCPWCNHPLDPEGYELVPDARRPHALVVACTNEGTDEVPPCPFGFGFDPDLPPEQDGLPIVAIDEQLYRELPSIVVGTVDKFASLPWRGAVGMLFGRAKAMHEGQFYGEHEQGRFPKGATPLKHGLPAPELIIQDELHLITGPLGTMVGLYETAIDAICRDRAGHGPKIIASTATAARATEQIRAIFGRPNVHLFPPQGVDEGDTFFARVDPRPEKTRVYVGVAAPGRSAKLLAARTYTTLLGAAQKHWKAAGKPGKDNPGDTYMTLAAYFNALKELGGAQRLVQEDVSLRVGQLDERRSMDEAASAIFARRTVSFDVLELTSRMSTDKIAQAIDRLNQPYASNKKHYTDVLLASSMISVGVDIGRLGLMVVNGQPRTTAEYIQASSRVGRQTPGLVVTALNLYKPRDRSHYERFTAFHETFYRSVEAASVTPFSTRAVDRGLAGLVVGLVRHLAPRMAPSTGVQEIIHRDVEGFEAHVINLLVQRAKGHRDGISASVLANLEQQVTTLVKNWRALIIKQQDAGTLKLKYSNWERHPKNFDPLLHTAVDRIEGANRDLLDFFRAPTSMRDVEPGVDVWVDLPKIEDNA